jgi:hypothetical protein
MASYVHYKDETDVPTFRYIYEDVAEDLTDCFRDDPSDAVQAIIDMLSREPKETCLFLFFFPDIIDAIESVSPVTDEQNTQIDTILAFYEKTLRLDR